MKTPIEFENTRLWNRTVQLFDGFWQVNDQYKTRFFSLENRRRGFRNTAWWNECDCDCLQKNIKKGCTIYFNNVILRLVMVIRIPDQKIYAMFFFHQFRRKICWHQQIQHSTSNDTWDVQGSVDVRHDVVGTCWNILKTNKWQTNNKKCQHVVLMSFTSKKTVEGFHQVSALEWRLT